MVSFHVYFVLSSILTCNIICKWEIRKFDLSMFDYLICGFNISSSFRSIEADRVFRRSTTICDRRYERMSWSTTSGNWISQITCSGKLWSSSIHSGWSCSKTCKWAKTSSISRLALSRLRACYASGDALKTRIRSFRVGLHVLRPYWGHPQMIDIPQSWSPCM